MSYGEHPNPLPVAVKRMGKYIILTQQTIHEQPDMLMMTEVQARDLISQLQRLIGQCLETNPRKETHAYPLVTQGDEK